MSADAMKWAKSVKTGGAGPKAVLLALADYADESHSCFPGQKLLAEITEQGERTVRRHLADLEARGLLKRCPRYREDGRGRTSDRFVLAVDQPADMAATQPARPSETPAILVVQPAIDAGLTGQALAGQGTASEPQEGTARPLRGFDEFYAAFPLHRDPLDARKAWPRALQAVGGDADRLIAAAQAYRDDPNRDQDHTKYPASWLRAGSWEGDPLPPKAKTANGFAKPEHLSIPASQRIAEEERIRRERSEHAERLAGERRG